MHGETVEFTWIVFGGDYKTWISSLLEFLLTTLFANILNLPALLVRNQVSGPHKTKGNVTVLYIALKFLYRKGKEDSAPNSGRHSMG